MQTIDPPIWNEHGERVTAKISSSDMDMDDIPRIMREHRDLRKALALALEFLDESGFEPFDPRSQEKFEYIKRVKRRSPW